MRHFIFCVTLLAACTTENPVDLTRFEMDASAMERRLPTEMIVSASATTPAGDIVLEGSTMEHVGTLTFQAVSEPLELKRFKLKQDGDSLAISAVHIEYANELGDIVSESGVLSAGEITFNGQELYVPVGATTELNVYVDLGTVVPGEELQFSWTDASARAIGLSTGTTYGYRRMTNAVVLEVFETHVTKPTVTLSASSPSGIGVPGRSEILRFNVAANSGGDVGLDQLVFQLNTTDNNGSGWNTCGQFTANLLDVYNLTLDGTSVSLDGQWELYNADGFQCGATEVASYAVFTPTSTEFVPAGQTYVYSVYADTMGASASQDDAMRLDLVELVWTDNGYMSAFDGQFVSNLPVNGGTIVY